MKRSLLAIGFAVALASWFSPAWAEVVVVVSTKNTNESMFRAELADLFLGRRYQFPDGEPAIPINQRERSQAYPEFHAKYLGLTPAQVRAHWSRLIFTGRGHPPRWVSNGQAMADAVADDPRAIGYLDSDLVDDRLRVIQID